MDASKLLSPVLIAAAMAAIAALSAGLGEAWLVPSLGSAVFAQALSPQQPSARPYALCVGQLLGAAAGMFLAGAGGATAPVVALGAETASWDAAGRLLVGIALVTAIGEGVRRAVLRAG